MSCPNCGESLRVPAQQAAAEAPVDRPVSRTADAAAGQNAFAEFVVYDDAEATAGDDSSREPSTKADLVAVPRRVIYLQGLLLGLVAAGAFTTGLLVGRRAAAPRSHDFADPSRIQGVLSHRASGADVPDEGGVVVAVPVDRRPGSNERAAIVGLRPGDPLPRGSHESIQTIRSLGGDYCRADENGAYELRLAQGGEYYILFLSHHAARRPDQELNKRHLAQLGRYFRQVVELLGDRRYQWRQLTVRGDRSLDVRL